jgi:hypothetical protein
VVPDAEKDRPVLPGIVEHDLDALGFPRMLERVPDDVLDRTARAAQAW